MDNEQYRYEGVRDDAFDLLNLYDYHLERVLNRHPRAFINFGIATKCLEDFIIKETTQFYLPKFLKDEIWKRLDLLYSKRKAFHSGKDVNFLDKNN